MTVCWKCGGSGSVGPEGLKVTCSTCSGWGVPYCVTCGEPASAAATKAWSAEFFPVCSAGCSVASGIWSHLVVNGPTGNAVKISAKGG
jgi:hypothetical protein